MRACFFRVRRFFVEQLERRELLATLTVNSLLDNSPVGDGMVTLREAIGAANTDGTTDLGQSGSGADTIEFAPELTTGGPATIGLQSPLTITQPLTIDGPGAGLLTVEQQLIGSLNRIISITGATGDFAINGLTLAGGGTTGNGEISGGGAIRSVTSGHLAISDSVITGNSTAGAEADGGGVFAMGNLIITNSTVSDNHTLGIAAKGGGIATRNGQLTISQSTVSDNSTAGDRAPGGGVYARGAEFQYISPLMTITDSTVSGNSTGGYLSPGGGIDTRYGNVVVTRTSIRDNWTANTQSSGGGIAIRGFTDSRLSESTVSGNRTSLDTSLGGGIYAVPPGLSYLAFLRVEGSTVSDNEVAGALGTGGGGIYSPMSLFSTAIVQVANSTISGNRVIGFNPLLGNPGGGILSHNVRLTNSTVTNNSATGIGGGIATFYLTSANSIVAGNQASSGSPDANIGRSIADVDYSLIGNTAGINASALAAINAGSGNLLNRNPGLAPLNDNGGTTRTHAFVPGSPAIDAGDPGAAAGVGGIPLFDQRQAPFARVAGGRLDMGAFEVQAATVDGDFNDDGSWDCADIDALTAEIANATNNLAYDLNGDQSVDLLDRDAWLREAGGINIGPGRAYRLGDANLDGFVDGSDFNIWNSNKFTQIAAWCSGDFNADGFVDGSDFNFWNANKFTSSDGIGHTKWGDSGAIPTHGVIQFSQADKETGLLPMKKRFRQVDIVFAN